MTRPDMITIRMPTRIWQGVDAEMDNASQTAYEDGDAAGGDYAVAIREAGWAAIGGEGKGWPPDDHPIAVALDRSQWEFVVKSTKASDRIYRELGDDESVELGLRALRVIEPQLD